MQRSIFMRAKLQLLIILFASVFSVKNVLSDNGLIFMSYNIQMTDEYYDLNKKQMVADVIQKYNVDIIGIQEYHIEAVRDLQELLPEFSWFGVGRDDGKVGGEMGPVFYNNAKFELIEHQTFWLSEWPDVPGSKSWNTAASRMVTWGRFRIIETGEIFYLFNTHFDHISVEARENSSIMLLEQSSTIAGDKPVIITGDFNFTESSYAYELLVRDTPGRVKLFDARYRSETSSFGPSGTYNGYSNPNPTRAIDFIFVNPFVGVRAHGVVDDRPDDIWISDHYGVLAEVYFKYPQPPPMPVLNATAGDGKVVLSWDDKAVYETREPFNDGINDFEGYKLYRSQSIDFTPPTNDVWNTERQPIFVCDLIDGKKGFTYYGIEDGRAFYLGDDTGIQHFYVDSTVKNGMTYFYMITAYDFGIPQMGRGFAPRENDYSYEIDDQGNIIALSENVVMITPLAASGNYAEPEAETEASNKRGSAQIAIDVVDRANVKPGHTYTVRFQVDSIANLRATPQLRHPRDLLYTSSGFTVYDQTLGDSIIYRESPDAYSHDNIKSDVHIIAGNIFREYWFLNPEGTISDIFDGISMRFNHLPEAFASFDSLHSGWLTGDAEIGITVNAAESVYFPWQYDIIFHDASFEYTSRTNQKLFIRSAQDQPLVSTSLLLDQSFNFEVVNKSFEGGDGTFEQLDLIVHDVNRNGMFEPDSDYVLAGHVVDYNGRVYWAGTVFGIDFHQLATAEDFPQPGDVYRVDFKRPFTDSDSLQFSIIEPDAQDACCESDGLSAIQVVPNPYIVTNEMEQSGTVFEKKLMFTHLPYRCRIKIFTVSGMQIRSVDVNNAPENGTWFWDLKNEKGQDAAPGYYIYHVKSYLSGAEKTGKFAILR